MTVIGSLKQDIKIILQKTYNFNNVIYENMAIFYELSFFACLSSTTKHKYYGLQLVPGTTLDLNDLKQANKSWLITYIFKTHPCWFIVYLFLLVLTTMTSLRLLSHFAGLQIKYIAMFYNPCCTSYFSSNL